MKQILIVEDDVSIAEMRKIVKDLEEMEKHWDEI